MRNDPEVRRLRSHADAEFEKLRTSQVRRLTEDIEWLANGLEAYDRDRPHIARERMDLVLNNMQRELQRLRNLRSTF